MFRLDSDAARRGVNMTVVKAGIDAGAAFVALGWVAGWLPHISWILPVVWYSIQIWESKSGQKIIGRIKSWFHRP